MKRFIKENIIIILFTLLLGLLFILWGRIVVKEFRNHTYNDHVTTQEARLRCLEYYGWEADGSREAVKQVEIPKPLNAVFEEYNRLQKVCGFNLKNYEGKRATCYTYPVSNFPYQVQEEVFVNLLIYKGKLIAGDCMSRALDGFMLPLDRKYVP